MLDKLSGETRGKVEPFLNRMETFAAWLQRGAPSEDARRG